MKHEDITHKIIGCAYEVYNKLARPPRLSPAERGDGGQVELKSVQNLAKEHEVQLVNYLNALNKEIGLLINFGPNGVDIKRKYRESKVEA